METKTKEYYKLIAMRVPPSDRWSLNSDKDTIYNSLTEVLEAYFKETKESCDFKLSPLKGMLYSITETEEEIIPEPPKKFNIYGDY